MYNNKSLISTPRAHAEIVRIPSENDLVHIHTKLGHPPIANINPVRLEKSNDIAMLRIERWALHAVSKILLTEFKREDKRGRVQKKFRVAQCMSIPLKQNVKIMQKNKTAHYQGLNSCGSVWTCPICAAKITERRRGELKGALERWEKEGGHVFMVTSTVPHTKFDRLTDLMTKFQDARRLWRKRKPWAATKKKFLVEGSVRCLEIVYSKQGWHVHVHELFFLSSEYQKNTKTIPELKCELFSQWSDAATSAGFSTPSIKGFDVQDGSVASEYVTKWGLDNELTKQHSKRSQRNYTPFDLLRAVFQDGDVSEFSAADCFQEYAHCTYGRAQLMWSRGLKDRLGINDISDEEICKQAETDSTYLGLLTLDQWKQVLKYDIRGEVLEYANIGGIKAAHDFINECASS